MNKITDSDICEVIDFINIFLYNIPGREEVDRIRLLDENSICNIHLAGIITCVKNASSDDILDELNLEYVRLFSQPSDFRTIPVASYHLCENKTMVSQLTSELKELYLEKNFILDKNFVFKEDHIVPILTFVKFIDTDMLDDYTEKYVKSWVPEFAEFP
ncbi:MAG: molecular chaperone TorD family protein [Geovibrio sp.]|nr:molecular chaperone TorD family protein [Geovibrio sp.]